MEVVVLSLFVLISVAFSAPVAEDVDRIPRYSQYDNQMDYLRGNQLNENNYGISPCAAAAAASARSGQYVPNSYDYGYPNYGNMYRADNPYNDEREMMSYSDMNFLEQAPAARSNYRIAPVSKVSPNALINPIQVPPMYGYPSPNVIGCNVPLFFSCTPSIVPAQMVRSEPLSYGTPMFADAYVGLNDRYLNAIHETQDDQKIHDLLAPVKSEQTNGKL